ncbi:lysine-specific demethylase 2A-like isoform X2 [Diadema setosum]|uniref:lysine-specific demethylase 2A-like isoform X2 n=1 Tax=Diadema setosum TaxID=31175 RepID=UPI003B3B8BAD
MASQTESGRSLRHKVRRHYDEGEHQDDEIEGKRTFTLDDKLTADRYNSPMVKTMSSEDFTLKWLQEHGFDTPLLFKESVYLDIKMPDSNFTVSDVKQFVGSRRMVDVMDVNTQKGIEMSMAQFARYYESPDRKELYNVISLEFSHTRLAEAIQQPKVVRQIDWVNTVWPQHLIETQRDSTNVLAEMKYPKVQKYCLMSVKGCYTDFHVDFGGTSVWYHILRGSKVFWLIPPTDENIETYENWVLSGKQGDIFLGDRVLECGRIRLEAGDTFMIPTGWIHAVYTPEDSLVFGGNILHTLNVRKQLRVMEIEDRTRVPAKFRYPFFFEIHWYALAQYVEALMGRAHIKLPDCAKNLHRNDPDNTNGTNANGMVRYDFNNAKDEEEEEDETSENGDFRGNLNVEDEDEMSDAILKSLASGQKMDLDTSDEIPPPRKACSEDVKKEEAVKTEPKEEEGESSEKVKEHIHLCWAEMEGLINLVEFLSELPRSRRQVPDLIEDPDKLLEDAKEMLEVHQYDDPAKGVTGVPVVKWPDPPRKMRPLKLKPVHHHRPPSKKAMLKSRKRRSRCKKCANCTRPECGKCNFCRDMKKFGGPGRMKQTCIMRQCLSPILPSKSNCSVCQQEDCDAEGNTSLMECHQCGDIAHPACLRLQGYEEEGIINEDLRNSWECPKCMREEDEESDEQSNSDSETLPSRRGRKRKSVDSEGRGGKKSGGGDVGALRRESVGSLSLMERKLRGGKRLQPSSSYQGSFQARLRSSKGTTQQLAKQKVLQAKYHMQSSRKSQSGLRWRQWQGKKKGRPGRPPKLRAEVQPKPIMMEKLPVCAAPKFVVRPAPVSPPPEFVVMEDDSKHPFSRDNWMNIFRFLDKCSLNECMAVCKTWNRWCIHPSLWKHLSLARISPVPKSALCGIVRRQPTSLDLSWTNISAKQLSWLLPRLPNLKELKLGGSTWPVVSSLASVVCPFLTSLDLQWVSALNDASLQALLSPPVDHRPGYFDERSRLSNLETLCLAGADITDATLSEIVQYTPLLTHLDVSFCGNLTDASVRILLDEKSPVRMTLRDLNIAGCRKMTLAVFSELESCPKLKKLVVHSCPNLAQEACLKFTETKGVEMVLNKPRRMCTPRH